MGHSVNADAEIKVWRDTAAEGVFATGARLDELQQIVAAAGLGADAGHGEAAEGLAGDEGAGNAAVDVEVANAELALGLLEVGRLAGKDAAGEFVVGGVGDAEGFVEVGGVHDRDDGSEYFFAGDGVGLFDSGEDGRGDQRKK